MLFFLTSLPFLYSTNKLSFTPEFLGRVKLVTSVASLVGVGLYNTFLKNVSLRKIFLGTTIMGSALGMTQVLVLVSLRGGTYSCFHFCLLLRLQMALFVFSGASCHGIKSRIWDKWWVVCHWWLLDHNRTQSGEVVYWIQLVTVLCKWCLMAEKAFFFLVVLRYSYFLLRPKSSLAHPLILLHTI